MSAYLSHDDPNLNRHWANSQFGPKAYRCPAPRCDRTGFGEQAPPCPDHPYRVMEEDR